MKTTFCFRLNEQAFGEGEHRTSQLKIIISASSNRVLESAENPLSRVFPATLLTLCSCYESKQHQRTTGKIIVHVTLKSLHSEAMQFAPALAFTSTLNLKC
jgi:hypothetical protein